MVQEVQPSKSGRLNISQKKNWSGQEHNCQSMGKYSSSSVLELGLESVDLDVQINEGISEEFRRLKEFKGLVGDPAWLSSHHIWWLSDSC